MLAHVFKGQKISLNQYFHLLLTIVTTTEDSKIYMLEDQNYVIHEDFIFMGQDMNDLYFTYIPLKQSLKSTTTREEIKNLAMNLIGAIESIQGSGFQELMNYFKEENFSMSGLKKKLHVLIQAGDSGSAEGTAVGVVSGQAAVNPSFTPQQPSVTPQLDKQMAPPSQGGASSKPAKPVKQAPAQKAAPAPQSKSQGKQKGTKKAEQPVVLQEAVGFREDGNIESLTQRGIVYTGCFAVLAIGALWSFYLDYPSEGFLYLSLGFTLLILDLAFVLMFVWRPGVRAAKLAPVASSPAPAPARANAEKGVPRTQVVQKDIEPNVPEQSALYERQPAVQEPAQREVARAQEQAAASYYDQLQNQTTLLSGRDETVFLAEEEGAAQGAVVPPHLEIEREGKSERIDLLTSSFIVGRNPQTVHYVENTNGVSRAHFEITSQNHLFYVKDLSSKNGTNLNGQKLVPYKEYEVRNGDVIAIGKSVEYVFRQGARG